MSLKVATALLVNKVCIFVAGPVEVPPCHPLTLSWHRNTVKPGLMTFDKLLSYVLHDTCGDNVV